MSAMRIIGHVLLWIGFLAGALITVQSTENPDAPWATIIWERYLLAIFVGAVGVVLLRKTSGVGKDSAAAQMDRIDDLQKLLTEIQARLDQRIATWQYEQVYELHDWIDENLAAEVAEFADQRKAMVQRFGLRIYGQIMTDFARGERQINRCWCASADGYADEVSQCLTRAKSHIDDAVARFTTAITDCDDLPTA